MQLPKRGDINDIRNTVRDLGYVSPSANWTQVEQDRYELQLNNGVMVICRVIRAPRTMKLRVTFKGKAELARELRNTCYPIWRNLSPIVEFPPSHNISENITMEFNEFNKLSVEIDQLKGADFHVSEEDVMEIATLVDGGGITLANIEQIASDPSGTTDPPVGANDAWYSAVNVLERIADTPQKRLEAIRALSAARQNGLSWADIKGCIRSLV